MNKEIKFRIWDKTQKEMNYIDLCDLAEGNDYWFDGETTMWDVIYDATNEQERFIIQQYTDLKDKNGKKIYEGDILLAPTWFGSLKCICIYQQENIINPIQGFGLYSYDSYFKKYNVLVESDEWDEFEVIGNIYESEVTNE